MIQYFEYYQLHSLSGNVITGLTKSEAKAREEAGLLPGEYMVGPFIGQRLKSDSIEDEKEKEQA